MTTATTTTTIDQSTMLVSLHFESFGQTRRMKEVDYTVTEGAEKAMTKGLKVRLDSPLLDEITGHDNATRARLYQLTLPSFLRAGVRRCPVALLDKTVTFLREARDRRAELVAQFVADYPAAVERTREKLGPLFDQRNYPKAARAGAEFLMAWRFIASGVPDVLAANNAAVYEEELSKFRDELEEAKAGIKAIMRAEAADLVDHLVAKLAPATDGKRKVLRSTAIENVAEWCDLFTAKNVTNDVELAGVVAKLRAVVTGVEVDDLRSDDNLRTWMQKELGSLKPALDALITDDVVGRRRIKLADDTKAAA